MIEFNKLYEFSWHDTQRFKYGSFGILKHYFFQVTTMFILATVGLFFCNICQMHYIFCCGVVF